MLLTLIAATTVATTLDGLTVSTRLPTRDDVRAEAIAILSAEELDRLRADHANAVFGRLPGTWASRGSGQEQLLALRSPLLTGPGACGAFLVLDDGVPIRPTGFCNINQLFELGLEQAGGLELLRGPGSAVHGSNALHGVIAVTPPALSADRRSRLSVDWGEHGFARLQGDMATHRWHLQGSHANARSERVDEGYSLSRASGQWRAKEGAGRLSVAAMRLDQQTAGFITGEGAYRDARRFLNANPEAFREAEASRLIWHQPLADGDLLRVYLRQDAQRFLQHFLLGQPLEENGSQSLGGQSLFTRDAGAWRWRYGVDVEFAEGRLRQTQGSPSTRGTPAQNAIRPSGGHYDYRVRSRLMAGFVEGEWALSPAQTFTLGLRREMLVYRYRTNLPPGNAREDGIPCGFGGCLYLRPADRDDGFDATALQLGWRGELQPGWQLSSRVARSFRFPQASELYRLQRGQRVEQFPPERLRSIEAGLHGQGEAWRLDLQVFAMHKTEVILRDSNGLSVPGAATTHRGWEADGQWRQGAWTLGANATHVFHRYAFDGVLPGGELVRRGAIVDSAPVQLAGLRLGRQSGPMWLELEGVHVGRYPLAPDNARWQSAHTLWHLRLDGPLSPAWRWHLQVNNLADRRYAERADIAFGEFRYFPGAGRTLRLGLSWSP